MTYQFPYEQIFPDEKKNKYNAKKVEIDGITFDSTKEGNRYTQLKQLKKAKDPAERVTHIELQVPYKVAVNGKHICTYRADFVVTYADGRTEVEDVKGVRTGVYKLKKKLVEALYNIVINEI